MRAGFAKLFCGEVQAAELVAVLSCWTVDVL